MTFSIQPVIDAANVAAQQHTDDMAASAQNFSAIIADKDTTIAAQAATITTQAATIAELQSELQELTGVPFGVNAAPGQQQAYTDLLDPKVLRYYFQGGETPVYPFKGSTDWTVGADQFLVTSHKIIGMTVDQLVTYYRQLPTDRTTYDCGWHEPGAELGLRGGNKQFTKAQYDSLFVRMRQAQQQVGDHIKIMPILEGIAFLAGNNPADELPSDQNSYDVIGVDPYFSGSIGQPYTNVDAVLDRYKAAADARGKPWAICETGVGGRLTGQARNDALTGLAQKLVARNVLFVAYFLGKSANATEWSLKVEDGSRDAWLRGAAG